jgi:hypothetical protein
VNKQSNAAGETGTQDNGKMKMSMPFSKILPWHWSGQPERKPEKP